MFINLGTEECYKMGRIVYKVENYAIQEVYSGQTKGYILFNTNLPFEEAHSHLNNFKAAKYLIQLMTKEKLPNDLDLYRLESICRVCDRNEYREKAKNLLKLKKGKDIKKYINVKAKNVFC